MLAIDRLYHTVKTGGRPIPSRLSRWRALAQAIGRRATQLKKLDDRELLQASLEVRWRAKSGVSLLKLMPEAYALAVEASHRTTGMTPYPVQVMGAIGLYEGGIAEMQTGEGKTLTAVLPSFLRALPGRGYHVITVNDYLAKRDCELMAPIYAALGMSVGCVTSPDQTDDRRRAYAQDITYGTAKEFGFDYLRDRLRLGVGAQDDHKPNVFVQKGTGSGDGERPVQRGHYGVLIDEADSILIDEARTPLIIGLTMHNDAATVSLFRWCQRAVSHLEANEDFVYEPQRRSAYLTDAGCRKVLLLAKPALIDSVDTERIYKHVEQSLTARFAFIRDKDYVIVNNEVKIVDEGTGRVMDGRKWQDGLHQAIEAKELVPVTAASGEAARITVQSYFRLYNYISGMTGTAVQGIGEIKRTYGLVVTPIPTNKPCIRVGWPTRVFSTMDAKRAAILKSIEELITAGRAILLGTPSVEASEAIGKLLSDKGIEFEILNAHFHEQEADIISRAGRVGKVTVATNMAGRGTDIQLDQELVKNGGLHVIATEMHSSARIDRQLIGRAARQGDPGSYQFFLSLEDELLRCLEPEDLDAERRQARPDSLGELSRTWIAFFKKTQKFLEKTHLRQRKDLLKAERHRMQMYKRMGLDPCLELTE
ncbi:MAG: translocase [Planctomycetes bacterium]|nr:translocase [Planctomycetota bacterium]